MTPSVRAAIASLSPVTRRKGKMGGKPCVRGTRITADAIVSLFKRGFGFAELEVFYPYLTRQQLGDTIRWCLRGRRWAKRKVRR